jgi:hypothetical protein
VKAHYRLVSACAVLLWLATTAWAGSSPAISTVGRPTADDSGAIGAAASATLLDPVPALLSGPAVTTNVNLLATKGTLVQGVGADGVTEIVVRLPASKVGARYTLTLLNDQGVQSTSAADDGALGIIGSTSFTQSQLTIAAVRTTKGAMVFAIYLAPIDFARSSGQDDSATTRGVSLMVQPPSGPPVTTPVTILRPPVVLIHGLWSDPTAWNTFTPFITDSRFAISRANYGQVIGN